jgi:23S rRNA-intervening sequence protein
MPGSSFRDLGVWQEAMKLTADIYRSTAHLPKHGLYGLSQQIPPRRRFGAEQQYLSKEETQRLLTGAEGVGRALSGLINSLCQKAA